MLAFCFHGVEVFVDWCNAGSHKFLLCNICRRSKKGKDLQAEFELYAADLLVGVVVDIALVGMLAHMCQKGLFGCLLQASRALPSRLVYNRDGIWRLIRF